MPSYFTRKTQNWSKVNCNHLANEKNGFQKHLMNVFTFLLLVFIHAFYSKEKYNFQKDCRRSACMCEFNFHLIGENFNFIFLLLFLIADKS